MKKIFFWILLPGFLISVFWVLIHFRIWERTVVYATQPVFGKNWANEVEKQKMLYSNTNAQLCFLGDSQMEQCEWQEVFPGYKTANRGIGGETTLGLKERLDLVPEGNNQILFLQIGINDLLQGRQPDEVALTYDGILEQLKAKHYRVVPSLVFYVRYVPEINPLVTRLNGQLQALFEKHRLPYIDINPKISEDQTLMKTYTPDGIHLNAKGYQCWIDEMNRFLRSN